MDKTGWLSLGREFHFANGTRLGKGWIKCLNYVPTAILGGPVADARSWPASGCNLVATEETLILGESECTLTPVWLGWPWLVVFPTEMSRR